MDYRPVVTIVINNYNYGKFLGAAIDSALGQLYDRVEVIVVDDGSTDESSDVIRGYSGRLTDVFQANSGQSSALNAGFARSQGDIVIFLDADDVLTPQAAALAVESFRAEKELAKLLFHMEVIDSAGRPLGVVKPDPHLVLRDGDQRQSELNYPFDLPWMPTSGNAFSARVLKQIFPIPAGNYGSIGADWYLAHVAALFGPVRWRREVGAYYRVHGQNNFELANPVLNLNHIRQTIVFADKTRQYLRVYADRLGLTCPPGEILSVSDVANRLISYKCDSTRHPIKSDRLTGLCTLAFVAALRRNDVGWLMKLLFLGWSAIFAAAPRRVAGRLAEYFLFPERRKPLNRWLTVLHRPAAGNGRKIEVASRP